MNYKIYQSIIVFCAILCAPSVVATQSPGSGPLAAAGALFYLSKYHYPNLWPKSASDSQTLMKVAQSLSTPNFMVNGVDTGQSTAFPLPGIERYIHNCGYPSGWVKFQGIRPCPQPYSAGLIPRLDWICQATRPRAAGCVLIGWYDHNAVKNLYKRLGGRWVTIIGWQRNASTKGSPIAIVVSDPSNGKQNWLYFEKITGGSMLQSTRDGQTLTSIQSTAGLYQISSGMLGKGVAILDGAALIQM